MLHGSQAAYDGDMSSRSELTRPATTGPAGHHPPQRLTVEEYESNGKSGKRWTKVGAAFPHKEGPGWVVDCDCSSVVPSDGREHGSVKAADANGTWNK